MRWYVDHIFGGVRRWRWILNGWVRSEPSHPVRLLCYLVVYEGGFCCCCKGGFVKVASIVMVAKVVVVVLIIIVTGCF